MSDLRHDLDMTAPANTNDLRQIGLPDLADLIDSVRAIAGERTAPPDADKLEWLESDYKRITGMLQDVCQKYHLGLGGEDVAELVVAEVERLHAAGERPLRSPEPSPDQHDKSCWFCKGYGSVRDLDGDEIACPLRGARPGGEPPTQGLLNLKKMASEPQCPPLTIGDDSVREPPTEPDRSLEYSEYFEAFGQMPSGEPPESAPGEPFTGVAPDLGPVEMRPPESAGEHPNG